MAWWLRNLLTRVPALQVKRTMRVATCSSTRAGQRGLALCAIALAMAAVLPSATSERVFAADAGAAAARSEPSTSQDEAKRSFLEKYEEASERLKAGLARLHARGRMKNFRDVQTKPPEWTTLEFFAKDGKRRVNIGYEGTQDRSVNTSPEPPESMLWTPETAAQVVDPGTEFALATYLSANPDRSFERRFGAEAWRYVTASYLALESLTKGRGVLETVERDPENAGWYHVRCRLGSKGQETTKDVWVDEAADFAIRKVRITLPSGQGELATDVGSYVPIGNGGWLPKKYVFTVSGPKGAPIGSAGEPPPVLQRIEYELLGVDTAEIPDSYFTLESLGISRPLRAWKLWLLLAAIAVLLIALMLMPRKKRVQRAGPRESGGALQQPGG